jgi:hypothetical protein
MFSEDDRKTKNWRSAKRLLRKTRNKRDRLLRKLERGNFDQKDKLQLMHDITDAKVQVSVLELRIGDKPE